MPYLWQKISKVRSQAQQHALQRFILNRSYLRAAASTTTTAERAKDRSRHRHCPEVPVSSLCFELQIVGIQPFRFNSGGNEASKVDATSSFGNSKISPSHHSFFFGIVLPNANKRLLLKEGSAMKMVSGVRSEASHRA